MNAYYDAAIYGPVLQDQAKFAAFDGKDADPRRPARPRRRTARRRLIRTSTTRPTPTPHNFVVPKMAQRVVIDSWDFDRAMDEAQAQTQAIYDKYK